MRRYSHKDIKRLWEPYIREAVGEVAEPFDYFLAGFESAQDLFEKEEAKLYHCDESKEHNRLAVD